jgi:hypothetical protein
MDIQHVSNRRISMWQGCCKNLLQYNPQLTNKTDKHPLEDVTIKESELLQESQL